MWMARATLDERLLQLPAQLTEFREYLDAVVVDVRTASDLDAAGAEVEGAHREDLARIAEAEHQASAAARGRREAEIRAADAETQRAEADAAAEDAVAETARVEQHAEDQLAQVRTEAATQVQAAQDRAAAADGAARRAAADRDAGPSRT